MKHTEIAFILDRSGSMQSMTNAAISGFNEFLTAQQTTVDDHGKPIPAAFTLILFDHEYLAVHNRQDIQTALPLTLETYVPRGSTALLDAIGRTIDHIGNELAATPEADRPAKVIIAILTDGEENASQLGEIILRHIGEGTPFTFRYTGGSEPGALRTVLPTLLFCLDYLSYYEFRVDDPGEIPYGPQMPNYLLGWCQTRQAARNFRLDRMEMVETSAWFSKTTGKLD